MMCGAAAVVGAAYGWKSLATSGKTGLLEVDSIEELVVETRRSWHEQVGLYEFRPVCLDFDESSGKYLVVDG